MFDFFKRKTESKLIAPASPVSTVQRADRVLERRGVLRPLPVPDVVEGDNPSDWALWEEAVQMHASQQQAQLRPLNAVSSTEPSSADKPTSRASLFQKMG